MKTDYGLRRIDKGRIFYRGRIYESPDLERFHGLLVMVRRDVENPEALDVIAAEEKKFICVAGEAKPKTVRDAVAKKREVRMANHKTAEERKRDREREASELSIEQHLESIDKTITQMNATIADIQAMVKDNRFSLSKMWGTVAKMALIVAHDKIEVVDDGEPILDTEGSA